MLKTHYLYRHIRLDKNEPFYIGIGTKSIKHNGYKSEYKRAFDKSKKSRSLLWFNVYNKCNGNIDVEILYESLSYDEIKQKEIEFINLYGRKNLGTGSLVNLTDGGEGAHGMIVSLETRQKLSLVIKGRPISEEVRQKISLNHSKNNLGKTMSFEQKEKIRISLKKYRDNVLKKVKCIETGEIFDSINEVSIKMFNIESTGIFKALSENYPNKSYKGYHFCFLGTEEVIKYPSYFKRIYCEQTSKYYNSVSSFCKEEFNSIKIKHTVYKCLKNNKPYKNYNLKYVS